MVISKHSAKHQAKKWLRKRDPKDYGDPHDYLRLGWWVYVNLKGEIVYMEQVVGTLENGWK